MLKKILNLGLVVGIVVALFFLSHYGWTPLTRYNKTITVEEQSSAERLKQIVTVLAEDIGIRNYDRYQQLNQSVRYIATSFEAVGCEVDLQMYQANQQAFNNIIAEYPDHNSSKPTLVIGAHYDSHYNPGADDNASGVAGLIELARLLRDVPLKYNLKFVAFVNEEPPFFHTEAMGSYVFVNSLDLTNDNIHGAIVLEMLGYFSEKPFSQRYLPLLGPFYPNRGNYIAVVGNFLSKDLVKSVYSKFRATERFPVEKIVAPDNLEGIGFSDHWSFWQVGIPAVMITDTAFLRNPHYHQLSDTADTLDFFKMAKVVHGVKEVILNLD